MKIGVAPRRHLVTTSPSKSNVRFRGSKRGSFGKKLSLGDGAGIADAVFGREHAMPQTRLCENRPRALQNPPDRQAAWRLWAKLLMKPPSLALLVALTWSKYGEKNVKPRVVGKTFDANGSKASKVLPITAILAPDQAGRATRAYGGACDEKSVG